MSKKYALLACALALSFNATAIELPSIPFPAPGSDEILFVVRNTIDYSKLKDDSEYVDVKITDYWTNRETKRKPNTDVGSQSIFATSGSKWLTAYMTVNINGNDYTMAAVSGYKDGLSATFVNAGRTTLGHRARS